MFSTPMLQLPYIEFNITFEIYASVFFVAAALMWDKLFGLQSMSYFYKNLSDTKRRYSPHEIDLLTIVQDFD